MKIRKTKIFSPGPGRTLCRDKNHDECPERGVLTRVQAEISGLVRRLPQISAILALAIVLVTAQGCTRERIHYDGPDYIMFSDTMYVMPVRDDGLWFEIPVTATVTCSYDRNVGVDIIERESSAVEGLHYELESNTVTIKAGENVGHVRVRGFYDEVGVNDDFEFTLRIVGDPDRIWDAYGDRTRVVLYKVCPFDLNAFTGWAVVQSSYLSNYVGVDQRLIRTETDPEAENTIILRDCFHNGRDLRLRLTVDDDMNPLTEMDDQVFASTAEAFGTLYGDGLIHAGQATGYTSYYSSCENFVFSFMTLYVSEYPSAGYNTIVGTFYNIIRWVSDDEAESLRKEGY